MRCVIEVSCGQVSLVEALPTIACCNHMREGMVLMREIHNVLSCRVAVWGHLDSASCKNLWELILVLRSRQELSLLPGLLWFSLRHVNVLLNWSGDLLGLLLVASEVLMRRWGLILPIRVAPLGIIVGARVPTILIRVNNCVAWYDRHGCVDACWGWLLIRASLWDGIGSDGSAGRHWRVLRPKPQSGLVCNCVLCTLYLGVGCDAWQDNLVLGLVQALLYGVNPRTHHLDNLSLIQ